MAQNYVYSDISAKNALYLEIAGVKYDVAQFSSSWAINEIPTAVLMLSIGRNARTQELAQVHKTGTSLRQMEKATVWFLPKGDFDRNSDWPAQRQKIFEGFFTGWAYRKISGKVHIVCNLIHWIAALSFSSALTKNGHVSNPTDLNAAAVLEHLALTGAGSGDYVSSLVIAGIAADNVATDVWVAIKDIFCKMALVPAMPCGPQQECGGSGSAYKNDVALSALSRIEGPVPDADYALRYKYGTPLKLSTNGVTTIQDTVANAIGQGFIESYSGVSFWDKLINSFCPMFGMAVVPMIESAIVIADCPAYRSGFWKEISVDDYSNYDMTRELHRPLRAVGVTAGYVSQTQAGISRGSSPVSVIGGCYAEDSVAPGDGMIMYVSAPAWLQNLNTQPNYIGDLKGIKGENPAPNANAPDVGGKKPDTLGTNVNFMFKKYAHEVFVTEMLRGQTGSFSGKLRFDIAPGSILKLTSTSEKFVGPGQDNLAITIYGCVQRVTVSINAEAGLAGTTFVMSHVRSELENTLNRTSTDQHPLFGASIHGSGKHGSPLLEVYDLTASNPAAAPPTVT